MENKNKILVVDDESPIGSLLQQYLEKHGYNVFIAESTSSAIQVFKREKPQVVISDIRMRGESGISLLRSIKQIDTTIPVILITAFPSLENAINALKEKAYDYLTKPFSLSELKEKIESALEIQRLSHNNMVLREMASLHEATSLFAATRNLEELLTLVMSQCIKALHADSGSIQLVDNNSKSLSIVQNQGIDNSKEISSGDKSNEISVSQWVYKSKKSLLIKEGRSIPDIGLSLGEKYPRAAISIPLFEDNNVIGVLNLNRKYKDFTETDLQIINVLASHISVAIGNAKRYGSLTRQLSELTFISDYSNQLMEKIEKEDIFEYFFNMINSNFSKVIDFAALLTIEGNSWKIVYWSPFNTKHGFLNKVKNIIIEETKKENNVSAMQGPAAIKRFPLPETYLKEECLDSLNYRFFTPLMAKDKCFGNILIGTKNLPIPGKEKESITAIISHMCIALINSRLYDEMKNDYLKTIKALAITVDAKDTYTGGHSELVSKYAGMIAREMNLGHKAIDEIVNSGLLHDIGKIGIPGHILNKPGLLTTEEFNDVMKSHSELGANIVKEVPFLKELYPLIRHHHERYNGEGYPDGLKGEDIPLGARILTVADAYAAMTCDRPYRKSLGEKEACNRLWHNRGTQFDADVTDIFLSIINRHKGEEQEEK